jgi:DNA polymerase
VILFLDTETFSEVPINHGTAKYAEGAEVLLTAFAIDEDPTTVIEGLPDALQDVIDEADEVVAHNMRFDRTVLRANGVNIPIEKAHCTMARARAHSLPGALGVLCDVLGVPVDKAKDKAGKQLIQLFCKPRPKNSILRRATKETHPVEWARFSDYAGLDVDAMREVYKRLPRWNYPLDANERALWELDQQINDRGFAIDLDLVRAAIDTVDREQKRMARRVNEMTDGDVEAATQRDALLRHLLEQYGVELPDMQKGTLERRAEDPDLPLPVRELIALRLESSSTSVAKYKRLLDATCSDGRLRGTLEWCGAARTGRWSGRLFQPQNLPRPKHSPEEIAESIEAIKSGTADLIYTDTIARASSAIRGAIVAAPGRKIVAADLSNIEGRVLAWLAGEEWKLDAFRAYDAGEGPDLYKLAYARSFGIKPDQVDKDQRQLGKVQELALGYQGAVGAFSSMAALYGVSLPEAKVLELVKAWRKANSEIVGFWYGLEQRVKDAILNPGATLSYGRLKVRRGGAWLRIVLPSGRALSYPSVKLNEDGQITYMGMNMYSRRWERLATYGGKLVENVTQAVARDVIAHAMPRCEAAGYPITLNVHDEIVTEPANDNGFSKEGLEAILATNPPWADGLPLAAEGFEAQRYGK